MTTREPTVWEMLAGSPLHCSAYYIPQGHAQYCHSPDMLCQYMTSFFCNITERACFADESTDELFTRVRISPCRTHHITGPICSPPGFYRLWKLIETSSMTHMSLPAVMVNILPRSDKLDVLDVGGRHWPMKLVFNVDTGEYSVGEDWAGFVQAKSLRPGDRVVLLRVVGSAVTYFATARTHSESIERHNINSDAVSKTIGSLMQSKSVVVTYSPLDPKADFLVPPKDFRNSFGVNWTPGMRVRKLREFEGENHVGTITSTTFSSNTNLSDVMRSLWRCHTVVWDEPNGFGRIHFSPWEVIPSQEQPQQQPQPPHTLQLFPL